MTPKLIALEDIASTVGVIPRGADFYELDPGLHADLIARKQARLATPATASTPVPAVVGAPSPDDSVMIEVTTVGAGFPQVERIAVPAAAVTLGAIPSWKGDTVVIMGSGASLTDDQVEAVHVWRRTDGRRVMTINTTFRRAPWADIVYATDGPWWDHYRDEVFASNWQQRCWTQDAAAARKHAINHVQSETGAGLSKKAKTINQGMSGGYMAIGLAVLTGAARIGLLGYDMKGGKDGGRWHGTHPPGVERAPNHQLWLQRYPALARDLKAKGVAVYNLAPRDRSALTVFPFLTLEEFLC